MQNFLNQIVHIDIWLINFIAHYGTWSYLLIFAVIFCETGLIITPFLPGDSLLFALGGFAAHPDSPLDIWVLIGLLAIASILGNHVNYLAGRMIGPRVFTDKGPRLLNKKHLLRAHLFYEKNGGKTIIIARFIPIIRTFAPFVAGVSDMRLPKFTFYNIGSAFLWVGGLLGAGYLFGSLPIIKNNFSLVIYGIISLSLTPPIFAFFLW